MFIHGKGKDSHLSPGTSARWLRDHTTHVRGLWRPPRLQRAACLGHSPCRSALIWGHVGLRPTRNSGNDYPAFYGHSVSSCKTKQSEAKRNQAFRVPEIFNHCCDRHSEERAHFDGKAIIKTLALEWVSANRKPTGPWKLPEGHRV